MFATHYLIVMIIYYTLPTADILQHACLHESNRCWSLANDKDNEYSFIICIDVIKLPFPQAQCSQR